jgi:hypothetical protein
MILVVLGLLVALVVGGIVLAKADAIEDRQREARRDW